MKRILKCGEDVFKATCPHCLCVFEYSLGELTAMHTVTCPWCEHHVPHAPYEGKR